MPEVKTYEAPELLGELLLFEISPDYCRDSLSIKAPSAALAMGTVLMVNADGTLSPWAAAAEPEDDAPATADRRPRAFCWPTWPFRLPTLKPRCSDAGPLFRPPL